MKKRKVTVKDLFVLTDREKTLERGDLIMTSNPVFSRGQPYKNHAVFQLQCKCGSVNFQVGQHEYLTVIKCNDCNKEYEIHEG